MLSPDAIDDLIHLRMPEAEAEAILRSLTPERVDAETLAAFVEAMSNTAKPIPTLSENVMDCCGTGGSGQPHYNTSTTVSFVLAAGGVAVVKFGNRAITSQSGSFDFLEGIGIPAELPLERLDALLEENRLVFLFAPQCYPALARFNGMRRQLGVKSIFNFLGPLLNPVKPAFHVLGVSDIRMQRLMADYLAEQTYTQKALVVHGPQNLDEIAHDGHTRLLHVHTNAIQESLFQASFVEDEPSPQITHTVSDNVAIFNQLIHGEDTQSRFHRMVCLNAGAGFWVADKASSIEEGTTLAADLLEGKAVLETVERCRRVYAHRP